jgi:hypothetical protein
MIKHKIKKNTGFIALMSAIIISAILLLITINLSKNSFSGRLNILDSEYKERSVALAEACVDTALLKLANNSAYTGNQTITVSGGDTCIIKNINPTTDPIVIDTKAFFPPVASQKATTNLHVRVNKVDLAVLSWEEI